MQSPPGKPQFACRPIHQFGDLAVHLGPGAASTGNGRRLARVPYARQAPEGQLNGGEDVDFCDA